MGRLVSEKLQKAIQALYADLRWNKDRQIGFNKRTCGQPWPQTTKEANKIYVGLEQMLIRLMRPHWAAFRTLVDLLCEMAYDLPDWDRGFVLDIRRKLQEQRFISPRMIKKVREVAHRRGVDCGFPPFRELNLPQSHRGHRE